MENGNLTKWRWSRIRMPRSLRWRWRPGSRRRRRGRRWRWRRRRGSSQRWRVRISFRPRFLDEDLTGQGFEGDLAGFAVDDQDALLRVGRLHATAGNKILELLLVQPKYLVRSERDIFVHIIWSCCCSRHEQRWTSLIDLTRDNLLKVGKSEEEKRLAPNQ